MEGVDWSVWQFILFETEGFLTKSWTKNLAGCHCGSLQYDFPCSYKQCLFTRLFIVIDTVTLLFFFFVCLNSCFQFINLSQTWCSTVALKFSRNVFILNSRLCHFILYWWKRMLKESHFEHIFHPEDCSSNLGIFHLKKKTTTKNHSFDGKRA